MTQSSVQDLKKSLHNALFEIGPISECCLLDYPSYYNIGDHLIWLGTVFYLTYVAGARLSYAASASHCSNQVLDQFPYYPILFQGGGNLGDLWPYFQQFRERIIRQYPERAIVILPQSIHFQHRENLETAAKVFNSHPNLTLFLRDQRSYQIAQQYFYQCRVFKAPDMALQMAEMPGLTSSQSPHQFTHQSGGNAEKNSILYLCRQDKENNSAFSPEALGLHTLTDNLVVEDWVSFEWMNKLPPNWPYIPGLVRLVREGWQRGLTCPGEWVSRQRWQQFHPYAKDFRYIGYAPLHRKSWSLMHSGMSQLARHRLVVTNRLHVHILCALMGIPHVVLPGSYHKIEGFYQAWSQGLPGCRYASSPEKVKVAVMELLSANEPSSYAARRGSTETISVR